MQLATLVEFFYQNQRILIMSEKVLNVRIEGKRLLDRWESDAGKGIKFELDIICSENDLDGSPEDAQSFTLLEHMTRDMEEFSYSPEPPSEWKQALNELAEGIFINGFDAFDMTNTGDKLEAYIRE